MKAFIPFVAKIMQGLQGMGRARGGGKPWKLTFSPKNFFIGGYSIKKNYWWLSFTSCFKHEFGKPKVVTKGGGPDHTHGFPKLFFFWRITSINLGWDLHAVSIHHNLRTCSPFGYCHSSLRDFGVASFDQPEGIRWIQSNPFKDNKASFKLELNHWTSILLLPSFPRDA